MNEISFNQLLRNLGFDGFIKLFKLFSIVLIVNINIYFVKDFLKFPKLYTRE